MHEDTGDNAVRVESEQPRLDMRSTPVPATFAHADGTSSDGTVYVVHAPGDPLPDHITANDLPAPWCPWHGGHIPVSDATIVANGPVYACRTCMALHRMRPLAEADAHPSLPRPPFIGRRDGLPLRPAARS